MRLIRLTALATLAVAAALPERVAAQQPPARVVTTARGAVVDDPARDAAIEKLTAFLNRYPNSPLRPDALFQLGELLVQRADDEFAVAQRANTAPGDTSVPRGEAPVRPAYEPAIARYEELVRRYPDFQKVDAAA